MVNSRYPIGKRGWVSWREHSPTCLGGVVLIAGLTIAAWNARSEPASRIVTKISASAEHRGEGQTASCSQRYHERLTSSVLPKSQAIQSVADAMRKPSADMPGRWLFWDGSGIAARGAFQKQLLATQIIDESENRMCVRSVLIRGGRIHCRQWKEIPEGYKPPPPKPPVADPSKPAKTDMERRIARQLASRVARKGAIAELETGTALFHAVQRATDELVAYASQPYRATLCNGTGAMVSFYTRQLDPLQVKARAAEKLLEEAHAVALTAVNVARKQAGLPAAERDARIAPLILALLEATLSPTEHQQLASLSKPFELAIAVREILSDQRLAEIEPVARGHLRKALWNAEFEFYARENVRKMARLNSIFTDIFQSIASSSEHICTCRS